MQVLADHSDLSLAAPQPTMQSVRAFTSSSRATAVVRARRGRLQVVAKVQRKEGEPRVIRGKCFVTKDVSGRRG